MGTETTARSAAPGDTPQRRPGRPRSEKVEQAILDATLEALTERGIEGVSLEDVAVRAGVGKSTLYRRWSGKEDLLIAAFGSLKRPLPEPAGESVRADLTAMLASMAKDADDPRYACQFSILSTEGERFPKLMERYTNEVAEPRREVIREVIRRGMAAGEIRPDADVEVALMVIVGSVLSRDRQATPPPAREFAERVVEQLLTGIAACP